MRQHRIRFVVEALEAIRAESNGRIDIWRQALDAFAAHPLGGIGGGSFDRWWNMHRPAELSVVDGHSLYLEVLAELGPCDAVLHAAATHGTPMRFATAPLPQSATGSIGGGGRRCGPSFARGRSPGNSSTVTPRK